MTNVSKKAVPLQVLLVEDDQSDLKQYLRDLPDVFEAQEVEATLHPCGEFEEAIQRAANPALRYDLIISDTYKGETRLGDAKVLELVNRYRGARLCPLVVYSSGVKPERLVEGPFVLWADKAKPKDIDRAIKAALATGVSQLSRLLHDEIDRAGSSYLWSFLESNWTRLGRDGAPLDPAVLERLLRRRASVQIGRLDPRVDDPAEIEHIEGLECYLYPPVADNLRLGEILRTKEDASLWIVLTPHCHLTVQQGDSDPRADFVLTIRLVPVDEAIRQAFPSKPPWSGNAAEQIDKLRRRTQLPAELGKPSGRYCFLPGFLEIPDAYCDLLQIESIPYKNIASAYDRIAVLDTPFAEALQSCFTRFYSAVGLPNFNPERFMHLIQDAAPRTS
jgi:hypothetical protein